MVGSNKSNTYNYNSIMKADTFMSGLVNVYKKDMQQYECIFQKNVCAKGALRTNSTEKTKLNRAT